MSLPIRSAPGAVARFVESQAIERGPFSLYARLLPAHRAAFADRVCAGNPNGASEDAIYAALGRYIGQHPEQFTSENDVARALSEQRSKKVTVDEVTKEVLASFSPTERLDFVHGGLLPNWLEIDSEAKKS